MRPASTREIGLTAEKSRNLKDVGRFGGLPSLTGLVNVGEHRESGIANGLQDPQPFFQSRTAVGARTRPIRLIERSLENEGSRYFPDFTSQKVNVLLAFDHAGPGDQRERRTIADLKLWM